MSVSVREGVSESCCNERKGESSEKRKRPIGAVIDRSVRLVRTRPRRTARRCRVAVVCGSELLESPAAPPPASPSPQVLSCSTRSERFVCVCELPAGGDVGCCVACGDLRSPPFTHSGGPATSKPPAECYSIAIDIERWLVDHRLSECCMCTSICFVYHKCH